MSSERPALVVFDMAGTTLNDDGGIVNQALREALSAAAVYVTSEAVNEVMGLPKPVAIGSLLGISESAERTLEIHRDFLARMLRFYAEDPSVAEVQGTSLVLIQLRAAGIKVALDTGFSRDLVEVIVDRLGWRTLLDGFIASDEVERGRPHPDMINALCKHMGITNPKAVAKIGDTPSDLQEGTAAGCGWVIGVTLGSHTAEQLAPYPHTHLIPSVTALPALFGL
ncbi:MAG: HAD hydrolase-like protein [Armatimonas sp.]